MSTIKKKKSRLLKEEFRFVWWISLGPPCAYSSHTFEWVCRALAEGQGIFHLSLWQYAYRRKFPKSRQSCSLFVCFWVWVCVCVCLFVKVHKYFLLMYYYHQIPECFPQVLNASFAFCINHLVSELTAWTAYVFSDILRFHCGVRTVKWEWACAKHVYSNTVESLETLV